MPPDLTQLACSARPGSGVGDLQGLHVQLHKCGCNPHTFRCHPHTINHPQVGQLQRQYADAKRNYDNEVVQHGDALKRYAGEHGGWAGAALSSHAEGCMLR